VHIELRNGVLKAVSSTGSLPEGLVSTEIERIEIYGLPTGVGSAEANGQTLPAPVVRELPQGAGHPGQVLFMSTIKVVPYLDMRKAGWGVQMKLSSEDHARRKLR